MPLSVDRQNSAAAQKQIDSLSQQPMSARGQKVYNNAVDRLMDLTNQKLSAKKVYEQGIDATQTNTDIDSKELLPILSDFFLDMPVKDLQEPMKSRILETLGEDVNEVSEQKSTRELLEDLGGRKKHKIMNTIRKGWQEAPVQTAALLGTAAAAALTTLYYNGTKPLKNAGVAPEFSFSALGGKINTTARFSSEAKLENAQCSIQTSVKVNENYSAQASAIATADGVDTYAGSVTQKLNDRVQFTYGYNHDNSDEDKGLQEDVSLNVRWSPDSGINVQQKLTQNLQDPDASARYEASVEYQSGDGKATGFVRGSASIESPADTFEASAGARYRFDQDTFVEAYGTYKSNHDNPLKPPEHGGAIVFSHKFGK